VQLDACGELREIGRQLLGQRRVETFLRTLKKELIYRRSWPTRGEAAAAVHEYIEVFYNRRWRHTTNGGKSPATYEALAEQDLTEAA
jgi:transposase InsO family protein